MKKFIFVCLITLLSSKLFAMDWSDYEVLCWQNNKEPTFEEFEYLSTVGATEYGDNIEELNKLFEENK